jgi:hypothetical protein
MLSTLKRKSDADESKQARTPSWIVQLESKGYAVIPNVLTQEECTKSVLGLNSFMTHLGIDVVNGPRDYPNKHGIIQHMIGHSSAIWDVRTNERVRAPFEAMYGTNDLLVSFDGACIMQPHHRFKKNHWWLHQDQSPLRDGLRCIQGYVNLTDSSDSHSGSLYVVPGSHLRVSEFASAFPSAVENAKADWFKLNDQVHRDFFGAGVRVHGGVGSMVLWDSRTVHQASPPDCSPAEARARYVVYVCMQPRELATQTILKKKALCFDQYRMTSHWPSQRVKMFAKSWRTYGAEKKVYNEQYQDRIESQVMLELAGKVPMTSRQLVKKTPLLVFTKDE